MVVSATAVGPGGVAEPPEEQPTFVQKLTKSIRDFGLGKKALFEGGVGAFAFGGIGARALPPPASPGGLGAMPRLVGECEGHIKLGWTHIICVV